MSVACYVSQNRMIVREELLATFKEVNRALLTLLHSLAEHWRKRIEHESIYPLEGLEAYASFHKLPN